MIEHWAIFTDNDSDKQHFIASLLGENPPKEFKGLANLKGVLFSKSAIRAYIQTETRHGVSKLNTTNSLTLKTMSSGEQKKALLAHIIESAPDYIILDGTFDNLDVATQATLRVQLKKMSNQTILIQLLSRRIDLLPFIENHARLEIRTLITLKHISDLPEKTTLFKEDIPTPLQPILFDKEVLIELKKINVSYLEKPILNGIDWVIKKGEFWELRGPNGSGKTTILSMVTGENPKGYGQELYIFGQQKGSGESVWDIKQKIGYFTPALTDSFTGYHSIEHMLISGLNDSIGLYTKPSEAQLRVAGKWLLLLNLQHQKNSLFNNLSVGQKRLVMCARAMIKHPPLLILDEPTAGLDDASAALFVALVSKFAKESDTTIIFVSHRNEPGLTPQFIYELAPTEKGSIGTIKEEPLY